ncbi:UNVERIFIED_CONTAM: hypothetical protein Slati_2835700 [Sesamum latifolium]|uniref:Uncharacterized protein n=1 Tax=Sesamum latifolium TaxID=2727402 RepID=A0AAW2VA45_9LAMI
MAIPRSPIALLIAVLLSTICFGAWGSDSNDVYSPCADASIQRSDGFTFAIAFAARTAFFFNSSVQLSPCDHRLSLSSPTLRSRFSALKSTRSLSLPSILPTSFRIQLEVIWWHLLVEDMLRYQFLLLLQTAHTLSPVLLWFMNLKRGDCRTCTGKEMAALLARANRILSALTIKTVPSERITVKIEGICRL